MSNVIEFLPARTEAFALQIKRLDDEFEAKRASVNAWPVYWFDDEPHQIRAQGQGFLIAEIQRVEQCIAAAKRYGADPRYFEDQLKRWLPDNWDRLKRCAPRDWDRPPIAR